MPEDREDSLEERRNRLGASLKRIRADDGHEVKNEKQAAESRKGMAAAMKLSSEFISAIIVGAGLGWFFDRFVGTTPWSMIFFLLLGFCAGVLNVLRAVGMVSTRHPGAGGNSNDEADPNGN